MHKNIDDRKCKWIDLINGSGNVNTIYIINFDGDPDDGEGSGACSPGPRPLPWPELINERIDWAFNNYLCEAARAEWLFDDYVPALQPYTGTEIFAEAFGCKVQYPDNNMPFAIPLYQNANDAASMKIPRVHDTPLDDIFEIAARLRQKAGRGAVMRLPDIQSPLDIAALILNKEEFYVAMKEDPQLIHDMIGKTKALLIDFIDEWFAEFGRDYIAHFPTYYMEGGITLSEDEIGAFSPAMFDEFVLGALNEFSGRYGGIGVHSCADSEHQWANFQRVRGLKLLNLINEPEFIKRSNNMYSDTVALWPIDGSPESAEAPGWLESCPDRARVVISFRASSRREAVDIASRAEEICARRMAVHFK